MDVQKLNETLMKKNSTEIAVSKINTVDKIRKEIIPNFASIDPYAKVILIQSVIYSMMKLSKP